MSGVCEACTAIVPCNARKSLMELRCPRCRGALRPVADADYNDPALTRIGEAAADAPRSSRTFADDEE